MIILSVQELVLPETFVSNDEISFTKDSENESLFIYFLFINSN